MEILGQISKNYYGSLKHAKKINIIEELINLGLRNLNWFLEQFNEYNELLENRINELLKEEDIPF